MKKLLVLLMALMLVSAHAQESTPNQITSGSAHTWTGVTTGSMAMVCPPGGGACSGGPGPLYDPSTNTIHFSYGQSTVAQTFAVNQALENAGVGIKIRSYDYSWDIRNMNGDNRQGGTDILSVDVVTTNGQGMVRRTDSWSYNTKIDWTTFSGTVAYTNPGPVEEFGSLTVQFSGADNGFWGGYFGPEVRNVGLKLNYTVSDPCVSDPLSSPSCAGYETAYQIQQCSMNPGYSTACPGYYTYQCSITPLFDASCPGYQQAYFLEQCKKDSLFSRDCEGYNTAYAIKNLVALDVDSSLINQSLSTTAANSPAVVQKQAEAQASAPTATTSPTSVTAVNSVVREPNPETRTPPKEERRETVSNPETRTPPKEERREVVANKNKEIKKNAETAIKDIAKAKKQEDIVAVQNIIASGMGLLPGFEAYQYNVVPDAQFYRSREIYANQRSVDNRNAQRFLSGASDARHQQMIEQQYQLGENK